MVDTSKPANRSAIPARPVRLTGEPRGVIHAGGTITYRVIVADRWVGWVGDGREWRGARYCGRRWWACWREDGDTAARWGTGLDFATRAAAVAALCVAIGAGEAQR